MDNRRKWNAVASPVATTLVVVIALLDHLSGVEVRIFPLYFLPIALAARYAPPNTILLLPALSTIAWVVSNAWSAPHRWATHVWVINTCTQAIAFATVGLLLGKLRSRLEMEQQLSRRDPLTKLANSRAFHEEGGVLVSSAARAGNPITLAYLDLDNFKAVNDSRGHLEGDSVLKAVAEVLIARLRKSDIAARLGGDEFAVLLSNTGREGAALLLERVREAIAERMNSSGWPVTVSIGAIGYAQAPATMEEAVRDADELMYVAKRAGRNRVHVQGT